jgi:hypothetical protein
MTKPTNPTNDSFPPFSAWLAALFLVVLGAKLWVVQLYGSPLPLWDQWYEAELFFRPWMEGRLTWHDFFAAHCEHRIFFTRLLDMGVIALNGRWEPLLQMAVNAFIHTAYACGLAFCLWRFLGRKNGWLICFLLTPFFALPYAVENILWAFNSQAYLLAVFSLPVLAGLGFGRPGSWPWVIGLAAAVMGLFTMASGVLAPTAVGGLMILRSVKQRRVDKDTLITLGLCLAVMALGAALHVTYEGDRFLRAHNVMEFAATLVRNLAWPFSDRPALAVLVSLPLVWLAVLYFRPSFPEPRSAEFLLVLGLWSVLQSAALAYGRGNFGETVPASRYMDKFNVLVIASLLAAVRLGLWWRGGRFSNLAGRLLPLVFAGIILYGLGRITTLVADSMLGPTRMMTLVAEERVETFMTTGDENDLLEPPTVRPDAKVVLKVLSNPNLRPIMPAACFPPASAPATGRLAAASWHLLQHSTLILYGGLGLFICLCGYGLVRSPLGLAGDNLPAFLALLALLASLGFVWSKGPVRRATIERELHYRLAEHFKSENNPKRAAIHELKADTLGKQTPSDRSRRP